MDGKLLWDAIDVEHSQLASGDDISPQRRPEKRPHKLFEAREDRDLGQVRPDGSDELSKVCCVEVVERGDEREGSGVDPQRAHRLGVRASPGDDPRGADGRLATKQKARARFLRCRDLFFKVEPEKLVERRRVARAVEVAEGLANKRDSQTSPDKVTFRIHDQDRHEHLVGDIDELQWHRRASGAGAGAAARAARGVVEVEVEFFGQEVAQIGHRC